MASLEALYHPPTSTLSIHRTSYPFISPDKHRGALENKVVLVTGASRGIGRATALAFAAAGAHVACLSRTRSDLDSLVEEVREKQGRKAMAIAIAGDVTDARFAARAVQETEAALGPIDVLVNNAGISRISDLAHEINDSMTTAWEVVRVNMLGTMAFVQAVVPSMIARNRGTIINVVSILGMIAIPYFAVYGAAKAGIIQYSKIIDLELRPKGIYTYAVHPCMSRDTTIANGAINRDTFENVHGGMAFLAEFAESCGDKVDLPAHTFVALCVEEGAKKLSGRFVDATYDLEEVIKQTEEEEKK
ncbi:MAG: hypothetical protein Q9217_003501 [Psora testacea]